jgi:hypothetical protein
MKPIKKAKKMRQLPEIGTELKTKSKIMSSKRCTGFCVKREYIDARKPNENGTYAGYVPGNGGDVWWVKHEDGSIGCYEYTEVIDR